MGKRKEATELGDIGQSWQLPAQTARIATYDKTIAK